MSGYDPTAENDGEYLVAFAESAGEVSPVFRKRINQIFEKHLSEVRADDWYPVENVAAAFEEIEDKTGESTLREGARECVKAVPFPDDVDSVEAAMDVMIQAQRDAYRNSDQRNPGGNYTFEMTGDRSARVGLTEPFYVGAAFGEGVFIEVVEQFGPTDAIPELESVSPRPSESDAWELVW